MFRSRRVHSATTEILTIFDRTVILWSCNVFAPVVFVPLIVVRVEEKSASPWYLCSSGFYLLFYRSSGWFINQSDDVPCDAYTHIYITIIDVFLKSLSSRNHCIPWVTDNRINCSYDCRIKSYAMSSIVTCYMTSQRYVLIY